MGKNGSFWVKIGKSRCRIRQNRSELVKIAGYRPKILTQSPSMLTYAPAPHFLAFSVHLQ